MYGLVGYEEDKSEGCCYCSIMYGLTRRLAAVLYQLKVGMVEGNGKAERIIILAAGEGLGNLVIKVRQGEGKGGVGGEGGDRMAAMQYFPALHPRRRYPDFDMSLNCEKIWYSIGFQSQLPSTW